MGCSRLTSWPSGFVGSSTVRITSTCPFPKVLPDRALDWQLKLRHSLTTVMLSELRAQPKAVQGMFGHKDTKITVDTYTHYCPPCMGRTSRRSFRRPDGQRGRWRPGPR